MRNVHRRTKKTSKKKSASGRSAGTRTLEALRGKGSDDTEYVPVRSICLLLNRRSRTTKWNHLRELGYVGLTLLTWGQIEDWLGLVLWLDYGAGSHRYTLEKYVQLHSQNLHKLALSRYCNIDLDQKLQELKHAYIQQQRNQANRLRNSGSA